MKHLALSISLLVCGFIQAQNYEVIRPFNHKNDGTRKILSSTNEYKFSKGGQWILIDSFVYECNANKLPVKRTMYSYDTAKNQWYMRSIAEYDYDANGNLTYFMDSLLIPAEHFRRAKNKYEYNAKGKMTSNSFFKWMNGEWRPTNKYIMNYDNNGNMYENIETLYNVNTNQFDNLRRTTFTFVNINYTKTRLAEVWNSQKGEWQPTMKYENTYNNNWHRTKVEYQSFSNGEWNFTSKSDEYRNSKGLPDSIMGYTWDKTTSKWKQYSKCHYAYPGDTTIETCTQLNEDTKIWENSDGTKYFENKDEMQLYYSSSNVNTNTMKLEVYYVAKSKYNANKYEIERITENYDYSTFEMSYFLRTKWNYEPLSSSGIKEIQAEVSAYPNPTSDGMVTIVSDAIRDYKLFDISGKLVKEGTLHPGSNHLDLPDFRGIYILTSPDFNIRILRN